jgi:hypothetical protein
MARIFISSTIEDLQDYRKAVYVALRRLGHQSVAMEDRTATGQSVLDQDLGEVRASDVFVSIIAWRYGYVPPGQPFSMTELELKTAREANLPCLIFLIRDEVPWPPKYVDKDPTNIRRFRRSVQKDSIVDFVTAPDELAKRVAVALYRWVASAAPTPSLAPAEAVPADKAPGPDVFLSYAHEDMTAAQSIAERIGQERLSVFWDRQIPVGLTWDDIVEAALDAAKCVVVLWSSAARSSEWVRIEATEGAERRILAPAFIEETKAPLRFRMIQAANLVGWRLGAPDTVGMQALISAIERCVRGKKASAD